MTKTVFRVLGVVASFVVGGAAIAADAPAVEWKVSDGGNGHWYKLIVKGPISWNQANLECESLQGHLATINGPQEDNVVANVALQSEGWNFQRGYGPWLGGFQDTSSNDYTEPKAGWKWITGEPWQWAAWDQPQYSEPNNCNCNCGDENFLHYKNSVLNIPDRIWNDVNGSGLANCPQPVSFIIEWEADCNGDGVVDYGQILSGELADTNNNGVPDVCELVITAVKPVSGASTGGTAVRINGNNFPISPTVTFGGVAATDIVRVSPSLITAVTPAGTPGMTMVTVNSASSESFYYRPSCDGDLDNNGTIDSSDLGLMLVNFGNCYESAVPEPQQQEPFILQSVEIPTPLLLNKK